MTTETRPRLVGAFTLVGLALTVAGFVAIGSGRLFQQHRTFVVFFPNPVGLKAEAPVTFRQAPLGEVREVELVFTGRGLETEVKVVADVRRGQLRDITGRPYVSRLSDEEFADSLVKAGLRAAVRSSSPLAGQKSLDFDFHPDLDPRFSGIPMPYPEIPTAPSGMEILQDKVEAALEKISDIPVDDVLTQVRSTLESAQKLLDNGDLQGALRNLRRGLETADRTLAQAERTLGSLDGLVGDTTMRRLDSTLERLDRTLATVDRNVERTADTQYTAGKSLDELGELLRSVRYLIDTLQRHPESLLQTLAMGLVLGGCVLKRSKVAHTYVLDPLAAREAPVPAAAPVATVGVEKVAVPDWLDRPQVTGRAASGEVVTDEFSRWGEPLARGVQRVVAENLAALLPDRRVLAAPFPPRDAVDHRVRVTLVEAARQADGSILVEARWEVLGDGGEVLSRHRSSHRAASSAAGAAGAVAGASEALDRLSREIADRLRTLPPPSR